MIRLLLVVTIKDFVFIGNDLALTSTRTLATAQPYQERGGVYSPDRWGWSTRVNGVYALADDKVDAGRIWSGFRFQRKRCEILE